MFVCILFCFLFCIALHFLCVCPRSSPPACLARMTSPSFTCTHLHVLSLAFTYPNVLDRMPSATLTLAFDRALSVSFHALTLSTACPHPRPRAHHLDRMPSPSADRDLSTACPRPHPLNRMPSPSPSRSPSRPHALTLDRDLSTACNRPHPHPLNHIPSLLVSPSRPHALNQILSLSTACPQLRPCPLERVSLSSPICMYIILKIPYPHPHPHPLL